jgi:TonB family protein
MKRIFLAAALCCASVPVLAQERPDGGVYELVQVETMPRPVNVPEMRAALEAGYPAELRAAGRQGTVVVSLVVGPDGATRDVGVVSSTEPGFDSATVAAVRLLRFTPAAVAGRPVAVRVELPIQWQLAAGEPAAAAPVAAATPPPSPDPAPSPGAAEAPPAGTRMYALREVEVPPRPRNIAMLRLQLQRLYPPRLRSEGRSGLVQVRFRVDPEGKVRDPQVVSSTHVALEQPTMEAIRHLEFTPAQVDGRPVWVWAELPIQWSVTGLSPNHLPGAP